MSMESMLNYLQGIQYQPQYQKILSDKKELRLYKQIHYFFYHHPQKEKDNLNWVNVRKNKVRSIKDDLQNGSLQPDDPIVISSKLTLFHMSVIHNKIELFNLALLFKANINAQTVEGTTPLHQACAFGRLEMVQNLLDNGADLSIKDQDGRTPLDIAQYYEQFDVYNMLINQEKQ